MISISLLGIDLAKNVFHLVGMDEKGKVVLRRRCSRKRLLSEVSKAEPQMVAMEACSGANHWADQMMAHGIDARLIAPQHVKPFVKSNKNDYNDAEAICEAALRPTMRFVALKSVEQRGIQSVHRCRSHYVELRTATVNMIRGLLSERGIVMPVGIRNFRKEIFSILETAQSRIPIETLIELKTSVTIVQQLDHLIEDSDRKIERLCESSEACQRLLAIEGIGPLTATAVVATMGDPKLFKNGRQFSASLGLVPKQKSSGGVPTLLGISKRGDTYVRTLLISGARSALRTAKNKEDRKSKWAVGVLERRGYNKASVALANKNARIIWALLAKGENYRVVA